MQVDIGNNQIRNSSIIFHNTTLSNFDRSRDEDQSPDGQCCTDKDRSRHIENHLIKQGRGKEPLMRGIYFPKDLVRSHRLSTDEGLVGAHEFLSEEPQNVIVGLNTPHEPKTISRSLQNVDAAPPLFGNDEDENLLQQERKETKLKGKEKEKGRDDDHAPLRERGGGSPPGEGLGLLNASACAVPRVVGPKLAQTRVRPGMCLRLWLITSRIGAGSFGETFTATKLPFLAGLDGHIEEKLYTPLNVEALLAGLPPPEERKEVCIKVEQENKNILRLEALALKKVQSCQQVVRYLGNGCIDGMNYLVMEKLGPNLAELRRRSPHGTFNIYTTLKAGISCLKAIRGVHEQGLVHRDIKPSNFVTGLPGSPDRATCYLIDFGLARRYRRSNGELRPSRKNAGFRGTSRYASVASHRRLELGRVDDLWSLLFMLIEFATGTLPWRKYKDKDDIGQCKEESITPQLVRNLPREFQSFLAHLQALVYEDEPDYDFLLSLMYRALARRGYPPNKLVDWELDPVTIEQVAEAEIRMSLNKRVDGNKNHVEKRSHNIAPGANARLGGSNGDPNEHDSRPQRRCPAPKHYEVVVKSTLEEPLQVASNEIERAKPALPAALPAATEKSPRLDSPILEGSFAHSNGIHVSEVELHYRENARSGEDKKIDPVRPSDHGVPAHNTKDASGAAQCEKTHECPAAGMKNSGAAKKNEGAPQREQTPHWARDSPARSAAMEVDASDFSSRECSRSSNKHSLLGAKGPRKVEEKVGDSLTKSVFRELDHQGSVLHTPPVPDSVPLRRIHLDAMQQATLDTINTGSQKPLKDTSMVKEKEKVKCTCSVM